MHCPFDKLTSMKCLMSTLPSLLSADDELSWSLISISLTVCDTATASLPPPLWFNSANSPQPRCSTLHTSTIHHQLFVNHVNKTLPYITSIVHLFTYRTYDYFRNQHKQISVTIKQYAKILLIHAMQVQQTMQHCRQKLSHYVNVPTLD